MPGAQCPFCAEAAPNKPAPDLSLIGDAWTCPKCGTRFPGRFVLNYTAPAHPLPATCDVGITPLSSGQRLAIVSERADNRGMSVTNAAERIAALICMRCRILPRDLVYVEHLPASPIHGPVPDWDFVTFKVRAAGPWPEFENPTWRPAARADWALLGLEDPRPFPLEVIELNNGPEAAHHLYRIFGRVTIASPHGEGEPTGRTDRPLIAWFSDVPEIHGEGAYKMAASKLSALYRAVIPPQPDELKPGESVAIYAPDYPRGDGDGGTVLIWGRGQLCARGIGERPFVVEFHAGTEGMIPAGTAIRFNRDEIAPLHRPSLTA